MNDHTVPPTRKGFSKTLVLLIGLVVVGVVSVVVLLWTQREKSLGEDATTEKNTDLVDTAGWKEYRERENGFAFRYPSDWSVQMQRVSARSFAVPEATEQYIVTPPAWEAMGGYQRATVECSISLYQNTAALTIVDWLAQNNIYPTDEEGLSKMSERTMSRNGKQGLLVEEGGPNAQRSTSLYFSIPPKILRFGYFLTAAHEVSEIRLEEFRAYNAVCSTITSTISFE